MTAMTATLPAPATTAAPRASGPAVLVTGASTGIGRACALTLDRAGFRVFAGVRKDADAAALRTAASARLTPVFLDIADAASVAGAARQVGDAVGAAGLAGLVNNAGIGVAGPVEYLPLDDLRRQFEVNVFGQVAVTQACLPLLRRARGRIVNIGSVGDRLTIPFGGALCGSKSALASLTDALRLELRPWGLRVCLIEPASIHTPAVDKTLADVEGRIRALPPEGAARYAALLRTFTARAVRRERDGSAPEVVAAAVRHALTAARPRTRYPVPGRPGRRAPHAPPPPGTRVVARRAPAAPLRPPHGLRRPGSPRAPGGAARAHTRVHTGADGVARPEVRAQRGACWRLLRCRRAWYGPAVPAYFVVRRGPGPAWDASRPLRAQAGWAAHAAFMDALVAEGVVILGGPLGVSSGAEVLLVVDAPDEAGVRARLAGDPWSAAGLLVVAGVEPWTVLLDGRGR